VLHYVATKPKTLTEAKPAVLIVMHGYGADEHDLLPLAQRLPGNFLIISLRAPLTLPWGGYAWYHLTQTATGAIRGDDLSRQKSEKMLTEELAFLIRKEGGDATNVTLMGFSQGAALIYALLSRHDLAALGITSPAAICLSGYIPKDCSFEGKDYTGLKMFMSHGKLDELIAPTALDEAARIITKAGADVTMKLYPIGHGISESTIADIITWMSSERLNP
jgi:phospholipase/carboxylesterase